MENKEVWRPVLNFEQYEASNCGKIRNRKTGRILSTKSCNTAGYPNVALCKYGKVNVRQVHTIIWEAFNGSIPEEMQINHLNEIKTDNRLENLNLTTAKENCNWGTRNKRIAKAISKPIICFNKYTGEFIKEFSNQREASDWLNNKAAHKHICSCLKGRIPSAYGYVWQYKH